MQGKRTICFIMGFLLLFSLVGCRSDKLSMNKSSQQTQDKSNWKYKQLGFEHGPVDKVQVSEGGKIFALSEGKLYIQEDGIWHSTDPGGHISTFYILEKDGQPTIVAGMNNGKVYLRPMKNDNWNQAALQTFPDPINFITANPTTGEIYIGQSSKNGGGLWKSNNDGTKWEKLTDITVRGVAVHPDNPKILYIVDKLTYRSTDGGKNWHKVNTGANYGVFIHPLYPSTAYLAFAQGVVSVRHDGEIASLQRFYLPGGMTRLEFNPVSLNQWALGIWDYPSGTGGFYYTFNSGGHWVKVGEAIEGTIILDLCYARDGKSLYIGTADKGLWVLNIERLKEG